MLTQGNKSYQLLSLQKVMYLIPNEPMEALLRISQDMAWVLDRLTAPKAPINTVRRHGAKEFHGSKMEELENSEFLLEK